MAEYKVPLKVGDFYDFSKTVTEADVVLFGGVTADFSTMHFNEEFCKKTPYGTRIVHGVLSFALASTASTNIQTKYETDIPAASYGYDHLRFTAPVFFGDTLTAHYEIVKVDDEAMKSYGDITVTNQKGEVVCVCTHILKFLPPQE